MSKFEEVYIEETIPKGMVLESIKFKNMSYMLTEEAGDCLLYTSDAADE